MSVEDRRFPIFSWEVLVHNSAGFCFFNLEGDLLCPTDVLVLSVRPTPPPSAPSLRCLCRTDSSQMRHPI